MLSGNREQSFGNPIYFTDSIASRKSELNTRQLNIGLTILFRKNVQDYDRIKKSVKSLSNHDKNGLIFT